MLKNLLASLLRVALVHHQRSHCPRDENPQNDCQGHTNRYGFVMRQQHLHSHNPSTNTKLVRKYLNLSRDPAKAKYNDRSPRIAKIFDV